MTLKNNSKVKFKVTIQVFVQNTKAFVWNISLENAYFRWSAVNDLEMTLKVNESHDLNTYLNVKFSDLSIGGVKNRGFHLKKKVDLEMTLKDNLKFKFKVTSRFLVENYLRCHLNLFKKYRSWENTGGSHTFWRPCIEFINSVSGLS